MGLNSNERKKDKSALPPSGRSWPFKRSKSKGKFTDLGDAVEVSGEAAFERKGNDSDYPSGPTSPTKSSTQSSDSQDGKGADEGQSLSVDLREEESESFSTLNDRERVLFHDLQEYKAKCAQMEKTMRWWSDCTANWREKWGKVRGERNKLKEEAKALHGRNEALTKEMNKARNELDDCLLENQSLRNELNKCKNELKKFDKEKRTAIVEPHLVQMEGITNGKIEVLDARQNSSSVYDSTVPKSGAELQFLEQILLEQRGSPVEQQDSSKKDRKVEDSSKSKDIKEYEKAFGQKTRENIALRSQLEQMRRFIQEREQKYIEVSSVNESLSAEIVKLREKCGGNDDRTASREGTPTKISDLRLKELRIEIERLQKENGEEWNRREQVETEKLALEREIKRLKAQIEDLEEEIRKKTDQVAHAQNSATKFLQEELETKSVELLELKLAHKRVQKQLQEKIDELGHEKKRTEQYESEVKKLRGRVEELKKRLCSTEESADSQSNVVRRLQRQLEEQTQHTDSLKSEIEHLNNRIKRQSFPVKIKEEDSDEEIDQL